MVITIILSILAGVLYRLGGIGKPFNTKVRDLGVPLIGVLNAVYLGVNAPWWAFLMFFGLSFSAMTTYHKWASVRFYQSSNDVKFLSWLLTGLTYGLAGLPLAFGDWPAALWRLAFLFIIIPVWSEYFRNVWVEEGGRGFFFNVSLLFFMEA